MNPFADQANFMRAGDQTVGAYNAKQASLYVDLIKEEVGELFDVLHADTGDLGVSEAEHVAKILDGAVDSLVVLIGFLHSMGPEAEALWAEVHRSNMSKVDPATGKLVKREDGKVLKPEGFSPPDLLPFAKRIIADAAQQKG